VTKIDLQKSKRYRELKIKRVKCEVDDTTHRRERKRGGRKMEREGQRESIITFT